MADTDIKAISFQYLIPVPFFLAFRRNSKIYIATPVQQEALRKKFNRTNFLLSILGFPFGLFSAFQAKRVNRTGLDYSVDFRKNITAHDFSTGTVLISQIEELFMAPEKETIKGVEKAFKTYGDEMEQPLRKVVLGLYIDSDKDDFYLAVSTRDFENQSYIRHFLRKHFYKHIRFDFMNYNVADDVCTKLVSQGVALFEQKANTTIEVIEEVE